MASNPISLQSRIAYPREAAVGSTYLVSVDLDHALPPGDWPYDAEEYPVTCLLDAAPYFEHEAEGDATIVVHRYGGSYGPARFWLTAQALPELPGKARSYQPEIRIVLINGAGIPIHTHVLRDITMVARGDGDDRRYRPILPPDLPAPLGAPTNVTARLLPDPEVTDKVRTFRWLHLADLQFSERETELALPAQFAYKQMCRDLGRIDAIILSGDVTLSGQPGEFARAQAFLTVLRQMIHVEQAMEPYVIMVPGNHDRTRIADAHLPDSKGWTTTSRLREEFWRQPSAREGIWRSFENFSQWHFSVPGAAGLLPGDFAMTLEIDGMQVGVVGLNDSIFDASAGGVRADVHPEQLSAVCGNVGEWARRHDLRILVTHHGPESMPPGVRRTFYRDFAPRSLFDVHLYGSTKMVSTGLQNYSARRTAPAAINAARFRGKVDRGLIGETSLPRGDRVVRVQEFIAEPDSLVLNDEQRVSLGLRLPYLPSRAMEPSIVERPLLSNGPAGAHHAIISYLDDDPAASGRKSVDRLINTFLAAGYQSALLLSPRLSREEFLRELHVRLADKEPHDLTVLVRLSAHVESLATADIFEVAATARRRLLIVENLPADATIPGGCGIISDLYVGMEDICTWLRHALQHVAVRPKTVKEFAYTFSALMSSSVPDFSPPRMELSEEIAELQMAAPKSKGRRRSGASGFDAEFIKDFPISLPRVLDEGALLGPAIDHDHFTLLPNPRRRMAWFAAVNIDLHQQGNVTDDQIDWEQWRYEPRLPRVHQLNDTFFKGAPFERSRLVKKTQPAWGTPEQVRRAFAATGTFANLIPLVGAVNRNPIWNSLPDFVAPHVRGSRLTMLTGPLFASDDPVFRGIQVPAGCWRIFAFQTRDMRRMVVAYLTYQVTGAGPFSDQMPEFPRPLPRVPIVTRLSIETLSTLARLDFGNLGRFDITLSGISSADSEFPGIIVTGVDSALTP